MIRDFLHTHKAFELIPESGKVVVLDVDLSIRQAFHALHEQCIASAALWDSEEKSIVGVISASDFIQALKRLRESVTSGASALTAVTTTTPPLQCSERLCFRFVTRLKWTVTLFGA